MKKFLLIFIVVLCLFIVACGGKNGAGQTTDVDNNNQVIETTEDQNNQTNENVSGDSSTTRNAPCMIIDSTHDELKEGDTFVLTLSIKNNPGIFSFAFELPVDDKVFEFVSADTSASICTMLGVCDYDATTSSYKFNGFNPSPFENLTADGTIVAITLRVKDGAETGAYTLAAIPDAINIINIDGNLVEFVGADISLNITK